MDLANDAAFGCEDEEGKGKEAMLVVVSAALEEPPASSRGLERNSSRFQVLSRASHTSITGARRRRLVGYGSDLFAFEDPEPHPEIQERSFAARGTIDPYSFGLDEDLLDSPPVKFKTGRVLGGEEGGEEDEQILHVRSESLHEIKDSLILNRQRLSGMRDDAAPPVARLAKRLSSAG